METVVPSRIFSASLARDGSRGSSFILERSPVLWNSKCIASTFGATRPSRMEILSEKSSCLNAVNVSCFRFWFISWKERSCLVSSASPSTWRSFSNQSASLPPARATSSSASKSTEKPTASNMFSKCLLRWLVGLPLDSLSKARGRSRCKAKPSLAVAERHMR